MGLQYCRLRLVEGSEQLLSHARLVSQTIINFAAPSTEEIRIHARVHAWRIRHDIGFRIIETSKNGGVFRSSRQS